MRISLVIDRLVLEGVELGPGDAVRLQAAFEAELGRLLTAGELVPGLLRGSAAPALQAAPIQHGQDATPAQLGVQIAQSVYGSLRQ
jgi:hypothetical protein